MRRQLLETSFANICKHVELYISALHEQGSSLFLFLFPYLIQDAVDQHPHSVGPPISSSFLPSSPHRLSRDRQWPLSKDSPPKCTACLQLNSCCYAAMGQLIEAQWDVLLRGYDSKQYTAVPWHTYEGASDGYGMVSIRD